MPWYLALKEEIKSESEMRRGGIKWLFTVKIVVQDILGD